MAEGRKRSITGPDGLPHDAVEMTFRTSGENWNEYLADDGSVIRIKAVLTELHRVEGLYDAGGNPVYAAQTQNVMVVSAPDNLRRQQ